MGGCWKPLGSWPSRSASVTYSSTGDNPLVGGPASPELVGQKRRASFWRLFLLWAGSLRAGGVAAVERVYRSSLREGGLAETLPVTGNKPASHPELAGHIPVTERGWPLLDGLRG